MAMPSHSHGTFFTGNSSAIALCYRIDKCRNYLIGSIVVYIGFGYEQSAILYARRAVIVVACMFVIIRVVVVTAFHNRT